MTRTYIGVVRKEPDTDYWVDFPDIPGCVIGAESLDSVREKAPTVLQADVDVLAEQGIAVAPPSTLHEILRREENPSIGTIAVEVEIPEGANVRLFPIKRKTQL